MGGSQPSPEIETVPETQPEPEPFVEGSKRGKRSHEKKRYNRSSWKRRLPSMDEKRGQITKHYRFFGKRFVKRSLKLLGKKKITAKKIPFRDINWKCQQFQEVFQRNWDNRESGQNDANVITKALEEYNATKGIFTYLRCWEPLRGSPKWANVPTMTSSVRRKSKRSKTSSSVDPDTPTSDARNVDLNIIVDDEENLELERPSGRRSAKNKGKKRSPLLLITKY
ncbi:uncharacterized protein LOC110943452 [Helianthus annuus]|uniref:uncharacterized protein LOC110943452 n=1 Tax=Helianthus annuus TaxID=4232 RepID=UPI001653348E|nr:uncharacterized protein LOC110943452 [Helianthus annuus]